MQLIIGLGNPGRRYTDTWHNLGFKAVDRFAEDKDLNFKAGKGSYYTASGFVGLKKIVLAKPTTYMNLSGTAVSSIINYYDVTPDDIIVVYDDINIDLGSIRLRKGGSAGGHNGMRSIIRSLGTEDFPRIRIGFRTEKISSVINSNPDVMPDLVLSRIPSGFNEHISDITKTVSEAIEGIIEEGFEISMNKFNGKKI